MFALLNVRAFAAFDAKNLLKYHVDNNFNHMIIGAPHVILDNHTGGMNFPYQIGHTIL